MASSLRPLIEAAADGDSRAFRELVVLHQSDVRRLLARLCRFDRARADDLAQETFLLVFRRLSTFRFEASFRTWLFRIATNVFLDDERKRGRRDATGEEGALGGEAAPETERDVGVQALLNRGLRSLREPERRAIVLTTLEEFTQDEAAEALGMPLGTLKSHVSRGKENLRRYLSSHGLEVSP